MECRKGKMLLALSLAMLLVACDRCPVNVGDRVVHDGRDATVGAIASFGEWSAGCRVGLVYDDYSTSDKYISAWKLRKR